jgi:transmembrane sensor
MMTKEDIRQLLYRYQHQMTTEQENQWVESLYQRLKDASMTDPTASEWAQIETEVWSKIEAETFGSYRPWSLRWKKGWIYGVAASLSLLFVVGYFAWKVNDSSPNPTWTVSPGYEQASLRAGNGTPMVLDALVVGDTVSLGHSKIVKVATGEIHYLAVLSTIDTSTHEIQVPKGGTFRLVLPDGSKVWMNAHSNLSYAADFLHNRTIKLRGEAYFEVEHDPKHPFRVMADQIQVEVLGTAFNLKAYPNEATRSAYVTQGTVKVRSNDQSRVLVPQDLAEINSQGEWSVSQMDAYPILAWKDNLFCFNGTTIEEIAAQVERWYQVEVELDPKVKGIQFYGEIPRKETANQLFEILEATNTIEVNMTGGKIKISKK